MDRLDLELPGYQILGELGRGGMGIVYKAQSLAFDRPVALKMILSGRGANLVELARFRVEAEAIASLEHPNIILIHEVGVHVGYPFFILEYAEAGSLAARMQSRPMPCEWTAHVGRKLALAMQHAHERGIVHRDLKPSNILMVSNDEPKVTDFGLVRFATGDEWDNQRADMTISMPQAFMDLTRLRKEFHGEEEPTGVLLDLLRGAGSSKEAFEALDRRLEQDRAEDASEGFQDFVLRSEWERREVPPDPLDGRRLETMRRFIKEAMQQSSADPREVRHIRERLTQPGAIMGTPHYMAPEQALGRTEEAGPAADIYALGAVLYEMLTGRPPFTGEPYEILSKVRHRPPLPPRQRRADVDPRLDAICLRCLEKAPERRYPSMGQLAEALQRVLDGRELGDLGPAAPEAGRDQEPGPGTTDAATGTWVPGPSTEIPPTTRRWWKFWE